MEDLLGLNTWGIDIILWVQSASSDALDVFFQAITWLGSVYAYLVILPFIFWCINRDWGRRFFFLIMISAWFSDFLKNLLRLPRPDPSVVRQIGNEPSYGMPSNHAQTGGVVFWGYLATKVRRRWFTLLAVVMAILLGLSRIYLGLHFPQDVLVGWLIGILYLLLVLKLEDRITRWWRRQSAPVQVTLVIALPLLLLLLVPADIHGRYPAQDTARLVGVVIGAGLGSLLEDRTVAFTVEGSWGRRLLRYLVGMIFVGGLYFAGSLVPDLPSWALDVSVRLFRYALVGLAGFWLAPWLFVKLGLADSELAAQQEA